MDNAGVNRSPGRMPASGREGILRILREHLPQLQREHGVKTLALFGSCARGDAGPESDVDILVEFARVPGLLGYLRLERRLSELLGRRVDLVMRRALRPGIARRIRDETVPV